jgi:hypothetical protein
MHRKHLERKKSQSIKIEIIKKAEGGSGGILEVDRARPRAWTKKESADRRPNLHRLITFISFIGFLHPWI